MVRQVANSYAALPRWRRGLLYPLFKQARRKIARNKSLNAKLAARNNKDRWRVRLSSKDKRIIAHKSGLNRLEVTPMYQSYLRVRETMKVRALERTKQTRLKLQRKLRRRLPAQQGSMAR